MHNAGDLTCFPLWYNGIPCQDTYPPLLHWIVALLAGTFLSLHHDIFLLHRAGGLGLAVCRVFGLACILNWLTTGPGDADGAWRSIHRLDAGARRSSDWICAVAQILACPRAAPRRRIHESVFVPCP